MGDPLVERMTAVEVGLATLGDVVDNGFDKVDRRMEGFQAVLMNQQKDIGISSGRMNRHSNPGPHDGDKSSKRVNRELDRIWEFLKLPLVGVIGGATVRLLDLMFK